MVSEREKREGREREKKLWREKQRFLPTETNTAFSLSRFLFELRQR